MYRNSILVFAMLAGCGLSSCSSADPLTPPAVASGEKGHFDLNLVVGGETIDSVHLSLTSPALPSSIEQDIDTSKVTGSVKAFAGLLPVGTYNVTFSATTVAGVACTGSGGPFLVSPASPATVAVQIVCGANGSAPPRGNIVVNASVSAPVNCPYLSEVIAAPVEVEAGGTIDLSARISDPAGAVFTWSAVPATGTFGSASSPTTTFTTVIGGSYTLTASLDRAGCPTDAVSLIANFAGSLCVEDFPCLGKTSGCVGTDQIVSYGEVDRFPACAGTTCLPVGNPVPCPTGTVCVDTDQPTSWHPPNGACVDPSTIPPGGGPIGVPMCMPGTVLVANPTTCRTCETSNCDANVVPGCDALSGSERNTCNAVLSCIRTSGCAGQSGAGVQDCYCGSNTPFAICTVPSFVPLGDCAAQIRAGYPAGATNQEIMSSLLQTTNPANRATALSACDYWFCGPASGSSECFPYCQQL